MPLGISGSSEKSEMAWRSDYCGTPHTREASTVVVAGFALSFVFPALFFTVSSAPMRLLHLFCFRPGPAIRPHYSVMIR